MLHRSVWYTEIMPTKFRRNNIRKQERKNGLTILESYTVNESIINSKLQDCKYIHVRSISKVK